MISFIICVALIAIIIIFWKYQNNSIVVSNVVYKKSKIPNDFNEYKIVHISDLHNKMFGENQTRIISKIQNLSPDIIVITGDLIDRRRYDLETAMCFIKNAVKIAPIYYVAGNHEILSGHYPKIKQNLIELGVLVLENDFIEILKDDSKMNIYGLLEDSKSDYSEKMLTFDRQLTQWDYNDSFNILLSHRPELFELYAKHNMDIIFSGHAHGGQVILPFIGALFAPNQGLLPKYTSGSYEKNNSTMFVSRGLGNSGFPLRVFNRPEIILVTMKQ